LLGYAPISMVILPFTVLIPFVKPSPWLNNALTMIQYGFYLLMTFSVFMVINISLIPFAYAYSVQFKMNTMLREETYKG